MWFKNIFGNKWISTTKKLPEQGKIVKIKIGRWQSVGYRSTHNGLWQNLAVNAMTIDFDKGIEVEFWKYTHQ